MEPKLPDICPECGARGSLRPILFGYPTPEGEELLQSGAWVMGGCQVVGDGRDPDGRCIECQADVWAERRGRAKRRDP